MTEKLVELFVLVAAAATILGLAASHRANNGNASTAQPAPIVIPVTPTPAPPQPPDQRKPRPHRPWRETAADADPFNPTGSIDPLRGPLVFGDRTGPSGTSPTVDFPEDKWKHNIGSKLDGQGMCVFASARMSLLWAGLDDFDDFMDWCGAHYPGGGTPDKLQKLLEAYCKAKNLPVPILKQYEGDDINVLKQCLANGWLPGCTLFHSPRYKGPGGQVLRVIYHMTNCAHCVTDGGSSFAILDNNFPEYEWMTVAQAEKAIKEGGKYWAFWIVAPGAPPIPRLVKGDK